MQDYSVIDQTGVSAVVVWLSITSQESDSCWHHMLILTWDMCLVLYFAAEFRTSNHASNCAYCEVLRSSKQICLRK